MTENFGDEIWRNILSEKRLNDIITWHKERSDIYMIEMECLICGNHDKCAPQN